LQLPSTNDLGKPLRAGIVSYDDFTHAAEVGGVQVRPLGRVTVVAKVAIVGLASRQAIEEEELTSAIQLEREDRQSILFAASH